MSKKKRTATLARSARTEATVNQVLHRDPEMGLRIRDRRGRLVVEWEIHPNTAAAVLGLRHLRAQLEGIEHELVGRLRAEGFSWDEVGQATGMSRQGAQKKYADIERALREGLGLSGAASG